MELSNTTLWTVLLLLAGCSTDDPAPADSGDRLISVTTYVEQATGFEQSDLTTYTYSNQGRLESSLRSLYNPATQEFIPYSRTAFTHDSQGRMVLTEATIINTNVDESVLYRYRADGTLSSMHFDSDVSADVAVSYLPGDTLQAGYLFSTGRSFTYRAFMKGGNPIYEKSLNASNKITDESINTFDDHVNPYSLLGYMDLFFNNYSKNNPLTAATQFYEGSEEATPESYEYTYNDTGLPVTQVVTFKSNDPGHKRHMKYVFEYNH